MEYAARAKAALDVFEPSSRARRAVALTDYVLSRDRVRR